MSSVREATVYRWGAAILLASVVLTAPLFICAPLFVDANFYGTCARCVLEGGVLERDVLYIFPPLMVWLRMVHEACFSGSSESIRAFDLLWTAITLLILTCYGRGSWFQSARGVIWLIQLALYVTTPTICHVQPDGWMLLPTALALVMRRGQIDRLRDSLSTADRHLRTKIFTAAFGEGVIGSLACLFKPQAIVILATLMGASYALCWNELRRNKSRGIADLLGWLCGGGCVLGVWMLWLACEGGWTSFWTNLPLWGTNYYAQRPPLTTRFGYLILQFPMWSLLHLFILWQGVHCAIRLCGGLWSPRETDASLGSSDTERTNHTDTTLYAAFYLGWVCESVGMQWGLPYHLLPTLFVATRWCAALLWNWFPARRVPMLVATVVGILLVHPLLMPDRLRWLPRCFCEGSTAAVRDGLTMPPIYPAHWFVPIFESLDAESWDRDSLPAGMPPPHLYTHTVEWRDLEQVAEFLEQQALEPRTLTCYHNTTAHLYLRLNTPPATRFIWPDMAVAYFPQHELRMREEFSCSGQQWVVSDLRRATLRAVGASQSIAGKLTMPNNFPAAWRDRFPWNQPIVFRAGRYAVHRVELPVSELTGDAPP